MLVQDFSLFHLLSSQREHMSNETINEALQIAVEKLIEGTEKSDLPALIENLGANISSLPPSTQFRYALFVSKNTSAIDALVKNGFTITEELTQKDFERIVSEASSIEHPNTEFDIVLSYLIKNNVNIDSLPEKLQWFAAVVANDQQKLETLLNKEYGFDRTGFVSKNILLKLALSRVITHTPRIEMVNTIQLLLKKGVDPAMLPGTNNLEAQIFCAVLQEDQQKLNTLLTRNTHIEKAQEYAKFLFEHGIIKSKKTKDFNPNEEYNDLVFG